MFSLNLVEEKKIEVEDVNDPKGGLESLYNVQNSVIYALHFSAIFFVFIYWYLIFNTIYELVHLPFTFLGLLSYFPFLVISWKNFQSVDWWAEGLSLCDLTLICLSYSGQFHVLHW